jgi:glycosyltransferase involved in cell wall biosynthesis
MRDLWAAVVSGHGHAVLLISKARDDDSSFVHEVRGQGDEACPEFVIRGSGWPLVLGLRAAVKFRPNIVVCLGHAHAHVLLGAALFRRLNPVYMGDTNGQALRERCQAHTADSIKLRMKRAALRNLFSRAFSVGPTNSLASELYGISERIEIPLLTADFARLGGRVSEEYRGRWDAMVKPRILCVARLVPEKNLAALLEAWTAWCAQDSRGSLLLVGDGPERSILEGKARRLVPSRFTLAGAVPRADMAAPFAIADALVLPSTEEAWGIVVTEALGLGIPVLATRSVGAAASLAEEVPGAIELVGEGPNEIVAGLERIIGQLDAFRLAAARGAPTIRSRYGTREVATALATWGEMQLPDQARTIEDT